MVGSCFPDQIGGLQHIPRSQELTFSRLRKTHLRLLGFAPSRPHSRLVQHHLLNLLIPTPSWLPLQPPWAARVAVDSLPADVQFTVPEYGVIQHSNAVPCNSAIITIPVGVDEADPGWPESRGKTALGSAGGYGCSSAPLVVGQWTREVRRLAQAGINWADDAEPPSPSGLPVLFPKRSTSSHPARTQPVPFLLPPS